MNKHIAFILEPLFFSLAEKLRLSVAIFYNLTINRKASVIPNQVIYTAVTTEINVLDERLAKQLSQKKITLLNNLFYIVKEIYRSFYRSTGFVNSLANKMVEYSELNPLLNSELLLDYTIDHDGLNISLIPEKKVLK